MTKSIDIVDVLAMRLRGIGKKKVSTRRLADVTEGGGIVIRRQQPIKKATYFDGSRDIDYIIQVVVVAEAEDVAIDECYDLAHVVPTLDLESENGSYTLTGVGVYSDPRELELTGSLNTAWEGRFSASMTTKGFF